jgi:hypothetical protein
MIKKYKYFLLEKTQYRTGAFSLTEDEFLNLYKTNCKDFRFTHTPIMRNTNFPDSYYEIDPSVRIRKSIEISNHYTLLIDNFKNWKDFPKRSKSLMCMYGGITNAFGDNMHRVIPFDNAIFGVAPSFDLWGSFNFFETNFKINIKQLSKFFEYFEILTGIKISDDNFEQFKKNIIYLEGFFYEDDYIKKVENSELIFYHQTFMKELHKNLINGKNFISFIDDYIDPKYNKFSVKNYKELIDMTPNIDVITGNEVWTESKCLLIKDDAIQNIIYKV